MESIIERIKKLLALAKGTPEKNETEQAMQMANKLMLEHNISLAHVEGHASSDRAMNHEVYTTKKFASWEASLLVVIARANLCEVVKVGRDDYDVLGNRDNVELTMLMTQWLREELDRLAKAGYIEWQNGHTNHMDPFRFHVSFKHGAVRAVSDRLQANRKAQEVHETALVLVTDKAKAYALSVYPKTTKTRSSAGRNRSTSVDDLGYEAGSTVALKPTKKLGA